jgi:hypothetical protein
MQPKVDEMEQSVTVRTTRITIETETLLVIRRAKAELVWCPGCLAEVEVIPLDNDSLSEPVTAAQIRQWLATSKLHYWQTASGPAQICLTSLFRCLELDEVQQFWSSHQNPIDQSRRKRS